MPINLEGVELLKADMRAHAEQYDQGTFGKPSAECGTVMCMAGFCRLREVGLEQYKQEIRTIQFGQNCETSGYRQLGVIPVGNPCIFELADFWPADLQDRYEKADTPAALVEVACAALDRLQEDGSIREL